MMVIASKTPFISISKAKKHFMMEKNKAKKILIVDDEECVRHPLELRLKKMGLDVTSAIDGQEAVEVIPQCMPDLIVLDLFLPKLSGEEVCKAIREHEDEKIASIPIVMVTAKDSTADRIVGKVLGANTYLTKPFKFEDLLVEIKKLISIES